MTSNEHLFVNLDEKYQSTVVLGDNQSHGRKGKGTTVVTTKYGEVKHINESLLVPALKNNLLFVGKMLEQNYQVTFDKNECIIRDKLKRNVVVARARMTGDRMFPLHFTHGNQPLRYSKMNESKIWHQRYGHLSFSGLILVKRLKIVEGLPFIENTKEVCEECVVAKQHRVSFPIGKSSRAKQHLEIIHMDLCGPMETPSLNKSKYFLTFIDDCSRKTWVYCLVSK